MHTDRYGSRKKEEALLHNGVFGYFRKFALFSVQGSFSFGFSNFNPIRRMPLCFLSLFEASITKSRSKGSIFHPSFANFLSHSCKKMLRVKKA